MNTPVPMPELARLNICPELYLSVYNLAKQKLRDEMGLSRSKLKSDSALWKSCYDDFKKSVSEKYVSKGGKDTLNFPNQAYFYNRYKDADQDKLGQIDTDHFKLLLIQAQIDGFDAIFEKDSQVKAQVCKTQMKGFDKNGKPYTRPSKLSENQPSAQETMLDKFQGTKWWFYFHGYNNDGYSVLVKLKFFFHPKENGQYGVEILNTGTDYPSFRGHIRTDVLEPYVIICELKTIEDGMRFLHLKFINSNLTVPEVLLGTFSNFEGTSVYAGSVIMQNVRKDIPTEFDEKNPETYYYPVSKRSKPIPPGRKTIEEAGVHRGVKLFFEEKTNNLVKMPSRLIKDLNGIETWLTEKNKTKE